MGGAGQLAGAARSGAVGFARRRTAQRDMQHWLTSFSAALRQPPGQSGATPELLAALASLQNSSVQTRRKKPARRTGAFFQPRRKSTLNTRRGRSVFRPVLQGREQTVSGLARSFLPNDLSSTWNRRTACRPAAAEQAWHILGWVAAGGLVWICTSYFWTLVRLGVAARLLFCGLRIVLLLALLTVIAGDPSRARLRAS